MVQVIAEAVGSLLDEKSRVLYVMMYIITRHQRYLQAGLEQLAAVAEYTVSLTGPNSKQFDWELPKQGEAPFVPTRPVRHPPPPVLSFSRGTNQVLQFVHLSLRLHVLAPMPSVSLVGQFPGESAERRRLSVTVLRKAVWSNCVLPNVDGALIRAPALVRELLF